MPVITLLTDFGTHDSYVAEMQAVLLTSVPGCTIVDVTHDVSPGDRRSARYLLSRTWHRFPEGSVHIAVVDPGVGTARRALAAEARGHSFVGPDNGLLSPILPDAAVVELAVPPEASTTFHGRDVFAPAAARLANGESLSVLGPRVEDAVYVPPPVPRDDATGVIGEVVYVDRFGTLISNVPGAVFQGCTGVVVGGEFTAPPGRTFRDVERGALVAYVGSGGTVEIAARDRSASQATGAGMGAAVRVLGSSL
ncbi:MAG: SAM-dependent chlorinase/fluorinase [Gemmatimonadales bacterium]|jgi:S-adenosylmethionine hydrolase